MDNIILDHNKQREENIIKGFYLDTSENRRKGRVGMGYDSDAGMLLSRKDLLKKFPSVVKTSAVKFTVKTGDSVFFEKNGKRFAGRITRYPSNDKIEINYGLVVINKNDIVGVKGKLLEGHTEKETNELSSVGQKAGTADERILRGGEKLKLEKEIQAFKQLLKERAIYNVSTSITEFAPYEEKLKRWKQLGGGGISVAGFVPKEKVIIDEPVENPEEEDKKRKPMTYRLVNIHDKVKDTLADHFDVDTLTAYRPGFMKSPLFRSALKGGYDEARVIDAFETYSSSFFAPGGATTVF